MNIEPVLRCAHVTKTWESGKGVLDDVSFDLKAGEWLSVIGPNGAGKTTLMRSIAGLTEHMGTVALASGLAPSPIDIAFVPQNPLLPPGMSVAEYVLIGRTAHLGWLARESRRDREIVAAALRRLDLVQFGDRPITELSGGEAQRVVVARAVVQQSPIVLLDEPTTALDLGHQTAVLEMIDELRRTDNISVIAAMHDLSHAARFADRLVLLSDGRIAAQGNPIEVLDEQLLSSVYATPLRVRTVDGELLVLPAPRSLAADQAKADGSVFAPQTITTTFSSGEAR